MADKLVYYFGYVPNYGHGLRAQGDMLWSVKDEKLKEIGFPWDQNWIDGSLLNNGKILDHPDGRVFWTGGGKPNFWFAFYWWDRSGDKRPASNSGLYIRGFEPKREQAPDAFKYACEAWPEIVKRQHFPLVLQLDWNKKAENTLEQMIVGPCRFCGKPVTEADSWSHEGELDAYPPKQTKVYHVECRHRSPVNTGDQNG